ncbi:MAG: ABC transporter substrate-binding protein [Crocosphaera sp.]
MPNLISTLEPGTMLDNRYEIIELLGDGGFGEVHKAKDKDSERNNQTVVIKRLKIEDLAQEYIKEAKRLFRREAQTLGILKGCNEMTPRLLEDVVESNHCYFVMEYIEGETLENQEFRTGNIVEESDVIQTLKELLKILQFIHEKGFVHRDIKPNNIMRRKSNNKLTLIDFGCVTKDLNLTEFERRRVVRAIGNIYSAPEQWRGEAYPSSDIYAVGMMIIRGLTGLDPNNYRDEKTQEICLDLVLSQVSVSDSFKKVIRKMTFQSHLDRYQSADEVLRDVKEIEGGNNPFSKHFLWWLGLGLGLGLALGLGLGNIEVKRYLFTLVNRSASFCSESIKSDDNMSCGEEFLLGVANSTSKVSKFEKKRAVEAFKKGEIGKAIEALEKALKQAPNDPEALIYLNNYKLVSEKKDYYTIAVAVPLGRDSIGGNVGQEMLRGVAQYQDEVNKNESLNFGLQVIIVNDENNPQTASKIAHKLGQENNILGVVGHYTTESTLEALEVYRKHKLVLISPTSTGMKLSDHSPYFFRVTPNTKDYAKKLAQSLEIETSIKSVAVFYNPDSEYSKSLRNQFRISFDNQQGDVVEEFDLSDEKFNAASSIKRAKEKGAKAFAIFPDGKIDDDTFNNSLNVIKENKNQYPIIAGNALYSQKLLNLAKLSEGLIMAVSWHPTNKYNPRFPERAHKLWKANVNWRTANTYDAAKTLFEALQYKVNMIDDHDLQRTEIAEVLKYPNFGLDGVTGYIQFDDQGDRKNPTIQLITVVSEKDSIDDSHSFVPIK